MTASTYMVNALLTSALSSRRHPQKRDGRNDHSVRTSAALLDIVKLANGLIIVIALAAASRSFAMKKPRIFPLGLGPMLANAKVKLRQWSYSGRASFISKKCTRARLEIHVTLPWMPRVRISWTTAKWGRGFTLSAKAPNRSARFPRVTAAAAI